MPVVIGVVLLVVVLVVCLTGGAAAYLATRDRPGAPSPSASPSRSPAAAAPSPSPVSPARCLIGRWNETSYTDYSDIYGVKVQVKGAGSTMDFRADGTVVIVRKVTLRGVANGDRYEVIMNGTHTISYQAGDDVINYSNPRSTGTITWKINGKVRDRENLIWITTPDNYTCTSSQLRIYGADYAMELDRVQPPGRPV
ncbi:hypothetical protein [Catellatospora sp. NPDC049609]|uniref:hypothetical protein n=1 Tax=Catellatospora sp. NPDC049609 TaxID=3155505 RepID=UPI00341F1BEE